MAGLRARTLAFNAATVDVTDTESAGRWRELLEGAGIKTARITGSGIFKDAASDETVRGYFFAGTVRDCQVIVPELFFGPIYRAVEHVSTGKAAAIGGAGSGVSFATATLADQTALSLLDPSDLVPWLQVATLAVGFITGLLSLALVAMKLVQQGRDMRS